MPKFKPSAPERLEYDFTPIQKADDTYCAGYGTIPEPNRAQLKEYREQIAEGYKKLDFSEDEVQKLRDGEAPARMQTVSQQMDALDVVDDLNSATRTLLANFPQVLEHYEEIPVRFQDDFAQWLMGELLNPEAQSAAEGRSPETEKSATSSMPSGGTSR